MHEKRGQYEALFRDQPVWKSIFALAVPSLLTILIMIFYNMADMFFIARLGDMVKVASVSIVTPVFSTIMALSTMIGVGGSATIAGAFGRGDSERAGNVSSLCFYSAALLGLIVMILLLIFQNPLLRLLGTKPEMMEDSRTYLQVLACGTVFMLISSAMGMHAGPGGGCGQGGHVRQSGGNADQYCAGSAVYPGAWMGCCRSGSGHGDRQHGEHLLLHFPGDRGHHDRFPDSPAGQAPVTG